MAQKGPKKSKGPLYFNVCQYKGKIISAFNKAKGYLRRNNVMLSSIVIGLKTVPGGALSDPKRGQTGYNPCTLQ